MKKESSNGRNRLNAARRRSIRKHLRDGIEAALYADPEVLANCKPRTCLGLIVRRLVLEAGERKMTAFKLIMQLLEEKAEDEGSNSLQQGISQGVLKKAASEAAEQTAPLNRQQRRRLAAMMRQRKKEDARPGHMAAAA